MWHDDGRCATAAETVTVAGTNLQAAVDAAVSGNKALVVVPGLVGGAAYSANKMLAIVGKGTASINGGVAPGLSVGAGELFVRDLVVQSSIPGVHATGGKIVLDSLRIRGNPGGGVLIDNAGFEIRNCEIRDNGPVDLGGGLFYGGIRTQNLPAGQSKRLERVTVFSNESTGISCSSAIEGTGVFATENINANIVSTCNITACQVAGPTCGAILP
jgi:Right handed beta helix region